MHTKNTRARQTLLIGVTLGPILIGLSTLVRPSATARAAPVVSHSSQLASHPPEHRIPSIDGAVTPDRIPDDTAYRLFLRMAAHPDPVASRTYLEFIFNDSSARAKGQQLNRQTLQGLVSVVNQHALLLRRIEDAGNNSGSPTRLHEKQGEVLASFCSAMAAGLGADGDKRLKDVIERRVKPKVRIFSRP